MSTNSQNCQLFNFKTVKLTNLQICQVIFSYKECRLRVLLSEPLINEFVERIKEKNEVEKQTFTCENSKNEIYVDILNKHREKYKFSAKSSEKYDYICFLNMSSFS